MALAHLQGIGGLFGSAAQQQSGLYQSFVDQIMRQNAALRWPKPKSFREELQAEVDEWLPKL